MQKRHSDRATYFEESAQTSARHYLPYIRRFHPLPPGTRVLEVGCGEGGNLLPFAAAGCRVTGIDLAPSRIVQARQFFDRHRVPAQFECRDFLAVPVPTDQVGQFDIILLHDVIEHVADKAAFLCHLQRFLRPGGLLFVAFPAWRMPFGGHQQIARHPLWSRLPYYHLLPTALYRLLLERAAHEQPDIVQELLHIRACRTSIARFEHLLPRVRLRIRHRQLWLINPHYEQKFHLRPRRLSAGLACLPGIRDFLSTSCFYLLEKD